jgi:UDP-N-acetylglucosamine transferase subunit ALG13
VILLTVGTQLPFDRFVEIVDRIAPQLPERIFAQVGYSHYRPANMDWRAFIGPIEFETLIRTCSLIISHAGIGTAVMAQKHRKPLILFPRRAALDEHRNDHQLATGRALAGRTGIGVAFDEAELLRLIMLPHAPIESVKALPERERLCSAIGRIVAEEQRRRSGA